MALQLKVEIGSPSVATHKNYKDMSICELIAVLRVAFQTEDFDGVEEELVNRDAKLKAEIGLLREKMEVERLKRIEAEEKLKMREEQCVKGKRAQENYEHLLKELKKDGLVEKDKSDELRKKNLALECEICELRELKKQWLDDAAALSTKNSELEESIKTNFTVIQELLAENSNLADEKRKCEILTESLERKFWKLNVRVVKMEDDTKLWMSEVKPDRGVNYAAQDEEVGDCELENVTGEPVSCQKNEDTHHSLDAGTAQSHSERNKDAPAASGVRFELKNDIEVIYLDNDDDAAAAMSEIAEKEHPSSTDVIKHKSMVTEVRRVEMIKKRCLSDPKSSTSTSSSDDADPFDQDIHPKKRSKTSPDSSGLNHLPSYFLRRKI